MGKTEKLTYIIVFMRMQNGTLHKIKEQKFTDLPAIVKKSDKQFAINRERPVYEQNNRIYYLFDVDSGTQLVLDGKDATLKPEDLDIMVGQKIIKELTSGVMDNAKEKFMTLLLGIVLGALAVGVILTMYYSDKIQEIYAEQLNGSNSGEELPIYNPVVTSYKLLKLRILGC